MMAVDVTSACRSSLNTGVKRIQRAMHASLRDTSDYRPLCWQSALRKYCAPSSSELAILKGRGTPRGLALFDSFAPGFFSDWLRAPRDRSAAVELAALFRDGDTLLLPDLLWDNRAAFLHAPAFGPVRRIGVFHDAIALRTPRQSRIDRHYAQRGIRALAQLDGVLCISREAEADLLRTWHELKIRPVPTQVAPWPVPFLGTRPNTTGNFAARRILYVARLEPHKNHVRLLEACELLWRQGLSFELQLIGCLAYPDTAWKILRRVRALGQQGRAISWRAHVSDVKLHDAYRASSATVFPSLIEGFGLPILESLWHGRPVICGNKGALGELASGGGCLTVDTREMTSIAQGLRQILTDESSYHQLQAEAVARQFRHWPDYWREVAAFCSQPNSA